MHSRYTEFMEGDSAINRQLRANDLDALLERARHGGTGLTDPPSDRDAIALPIATIKQALSGQHPRNARLLAVSEGDTLRVALSETA